MLQRDAELAALRGRLDEIRTGAGRVVVVEGMAGIGKSSLLTAVARDGAAAGVRVLRAWGGPLEQEAGWGVARRLFAPVRDGPVIRLMVRGQDCGSPPALARTKSQASS